MRISDWSSDVCSSYLHFSAAPARVAIVGGGYIGVELSGLLRMLGSEVELFARRARVLHDFDRELVERLQENYRQTGIALRLEHDVTALERAGAGRVRIAGVAEAFDAVLFATGRQPNTGDLGLDAAGVDTDAAGPVCGIG